MEDLKQYLRDHPEWGIGGGVFAWLWEHVVLLLPGMLSFITTLGAFAGAIAAIATAWLKVADWWRAIGEPMWFRLRKRFNR